MSEQMREPTLIGTVVRTADGLLWERHGSGWHALIPEVRPVNWSDVLRDLDEAQVVFQPEMPDWAR